jgi:hypothetical protein
MGCLRWALLDVEGDRRGTPSLENKKTYGGAFG